MNTWYLLLDHQDREDQHRQEHPMMKKMNVSIIKSAKWLHINV